LDASDGVVVEKQIVVCATLVGDPSQRLDEILVRQIDTPEKFLRLINLLLGLGNSGFSPEGLAGQQSSDGTWTKRRLWFRLARDDGSFSRREA
jgi:hypothetical protein